MKTLNLLLALCFLLICLTNLINSICNLPPNPMRNINRVRLTNNKYENLLISIDNKLAEDLNIIEKIKEYFTDASIQLYQSTNNRASFGEITILVPTNWTKASNVTASWESSLNAHINVGRTTREWGDNPFTYMKGGECGTPGEFIYLTDNYLKNTPNSESLFGPIGSTLVHEWGHLRWGLLDEFNWQQNIPNCYTTPNGNFPVKCAQALSGSIVIHKGQCRFTPNSGSNQAAEASIMYMHHITKLTKFCDSKNDSRTKHDSDAMNPHNRMCSDKSAWDIMEEHADFKNNNNPPNNPEFDAKPTFKIVRTGPTRYVMVYDVSGSMGNKKRLEKLRQAARKFFVNKALQNSFAGSVEFSNRATISHKMIHIKNNDDRNSLISALPLVADSGTCIGCGLQTSLEALRRSGLETKGANIIVLTDGEENVKPFIRTVSKAMLNSGARVFSMFLVDTDFSQDLHELSLCTGGTSFSYSDSGLSGDMYDNFMQILQSTNDNSPVIPIMIKSEIINVDANSQSNFLLKVDNSVAENLKLTITWNDNTCDISAILKTPSNVIIDKNSTRYIEDMVDTTININAEGEKSGNWEIKLINEGRVKCPVKFNAESSGKKENENLISLTSTISGTTANFNSAEPPKISIHGDIKSGKIPVRGANVTAILETNNNYLIRKRLLDNGAGADLKGGDGIYSSYVTEYNGNGLYSVRLEVDGTQTRAVTMTRSYGAGAPPVKFWDMQVSEDSTPLESFERSSMAGSIQVENYRPSITYYPPGRITDLTVEKVRNNWLINFLWTAVGNQLDTGKATRYEIYYAFKTADLSQGCVRTCTKVPDHLIKEGDLNAPKQAGQLERFIVDFTSLKFGTKTTVFVGINVYNRLNMSSRSNYVDCQYMQVPVQNDNNESTTGGGLSGGKIAGIVVGCLAVVCIVAVIVGIMVKGGGIKKNNKVDENDKNFKSDKMSQVVIKP